MFNKTFANASHFKEPTNSLQITNLIAVVTILDVLHLMYFLFWIYFIVPSIVETKLNIYQFYNINCKINNTAVRDQKYVPILESNSLIK